MATAYPHVCDRKIPFSCTRRGYIQALDMGGGRRAPYLKFNHTPSRDAVSGSVRGSVRRLAVQMATAYPHVCDLKIPFLCTRRGYIHVLNMGGGRRAPYLVFPLLAPSRGAAPGSVRGSVRPLRPLMLAASPEVLDPKIPFLCTQREYFVGPNTRGGRREPYLFYAGDHPPDAVITPVPGPVRPLRSPMSMASPHACDLKVPFLCTQR